MISKVSAVLLGLVALGGLTPVQAHQAAAPPRSEQAEDHAFLELLARARAGDVSTYVDVAFHYLDDEQGQRDVKEATRWLSAGVSAGDPESMVELGNLYFEGEAVTEDRRKALALYRRAAGLGYLDGIYNVGVVHENEGRQVEALRWYRRAADAGSEDGMFSVGNAYHHGRGARIDMVQAVFWLRKAVEAGSVAAMNDLGTLYSSGHGVPRDDAEALKLFIAAANNGSATGMSNVAVVHHNGEGVPVDYVEAIRWYQMAADRGNLQAYYRLGLMCEAGEGVKYDAATALGMYRNAAASEDPVLRQKALEAIDRIENGGDNDPRIV